MRLTALALLTTIALPLQARPKNDAGRTETEVRDRTGADVLWQKDEAARAEAAIVVRRLLRKPLTVSSAVQIALLNNRKLQATFEEIGVASADVLEAVTVPNPSIEFEVQFPFTADTLNRYAWLVAQEFVQIVMIPLKKRVSEEALEAAQLRVAAQVLGLVADVKREYFSAQAEQQLLGRLKVIQETTSTSLELSQKQFKAGNITELALLQMQSTYSEGRLDIQQSETELDEHREELNKLLGLWGSQTDWEIEGDLPMPRKETFSQPRLESLAVSNRLDLRAAQRDLTSLVSALGLTKTFRWVPVLDFGFAGERDVDGALNMGPQFRLELPIFNQGQARVAKGQAQVRRVAAEFEDLAVDIRADTRKFNRRLADQRERSNFYHDVLLPARIKIVNQSILQYNAMQISPFELFTAKAEELRVERAYIDALREYWITRAELEKAVGGSLNPHSSPDKNIIPEHKK
jgi:cobalt-zinc-cadmium efflux system outer membrane protein